MIKLATVLLATLIATSAEAIPTNQLGTWDSQMSWASTIDGGGWRLPTVTEIGAMDLVGDYWTADAGFLGDEYARVWDSVTGKDYNALKGVPYMAVAVRTTPEPTWLTFLAGAVLAAWISLRKGLKG